MMVLIQQNCVSVYLHATTEQDRKPEHVYEASMDRMLQMIR